MQQNCKNNISMKAVIISGILSYVVVAQHYVCGILIFSNVAWERNNEPYKLYDTLN